MSASCLHAVSKGIVDAHNGILSVCSEGEGRGCTFTVELQLVARAEGRLEGHIVRCESRGQADESIQQQQQQQLPLSVGVLDDFIEDKSLTVGSSTAPRPRPISTLNRGSLIYCQIEGVDARTPPTLAALASNNDTSAVARRFLVVDDSAMNRKMMCKLLSRAGAVCVEAEDGLDGLLKYRAAVEQGGGFDGILMDYQMPVMDGRACHVMLSPPSTLCCTASRGRLLC